MPAATEAPLTTVFIKEALMSRLLKVLILISLIAPAASQASPFFQGNPRYLDEQSQALAEKVLAAHGGMQPWADAHSLQFKFFTKMINGPMPFYSFESLDLESGAAYIDWLLFDATVAWDKQRLWSNNWPMPISSGFFVRLTSSFITLPWQIQSDSARLGPVSQGQTPEQDGVTYDILRVTFDQRSPAIPGTFYDLYVDPKSGLMKAIRFDINHPGMVANPKQPLGPNFHVFGEFRRVDGLILPTFYKSYGQGSAQGGKSNAYHFAWDIRLDQPFDASRLEPPEGAKLDQISMDWWLGHSRPAAASTNNTSE
jgi:hypothetical protein